MSESATHRQVQCVDIDTFIAQRIGQQHISSKSFLVTVFGDVVSQHGGWIWLGSLIESLAPLGFSERLIRTSVFRLVKDNWLTSRKIGRKSFYGFTDFASQAYTKAARRIYAGEAAVSSGDWIFLLPTFVPDEQMASLRKQLRWLGFSSLASGAYAHPSIDKDSLTELLQEMSLKESVVLFRSQIFDQASGRVLKQLVSAKWDLQTLQSEYRQFNQDYEVLYQLLLKGNLANAPDNKELIGTSENIATFRLSDKQSFLLRNILIHEFRRILLKDHELPKNMLPEDWQAFATVELVKSIYHLLKPGSQRYIRSHLQNMQGLLPPADAGFEQRFSQGH